MVPTFRKERERWGTLGYTDRRKGGPPAYIIYRVVRMAPSVLFPPLWETIPLNAAIP